MRRQALCGLLNNLSYVFASFQPATTIESHATLGFVSVSNFTAQ